MRLDLLVVLVDWNFVKALSPANLKIKKLLYSTTSSNNFRKQLLHENGPFFTPHCTQAMSTNYSGGWVGPPNIMGGYTESLENSSNSGSRGW
jgi:hypothetical protein